MFGGPPKNPFGSPFGASSGSNIFGSDQASGKNNRKRGSEATGSGLFGMPPVPKIGDPSPFSTQKSADSVHEGEPFAKKSNAPTNLFASALKSAPTSNIFSSSAPKTAAPFGEPPPLFSSAKIEKPDLFKSIGKKDPPPSNNKAKSVFKVSGDSQGLFNAEKPFGGNPFKKTEDVPKNPFVKESAPPTKLTRFYKPVGDRENPFGTSSKPDDSQSVFKTSSESRIFGNSASSSSEGKISNNPFKSTFTGAAAPAFSSTGAKESSFKFAIPNSLQGRLGKRPAQFEEEEEEAPKPGEAAPAKVERLASVEEIKTIKSIICEQIPQQGLNKKVLEKHFSKFGKVNKVIINLKKAKATVLFDDHKSAKKAKEKGHTITPKIPDIGAIFYHKRVRKNTGEIEFTPEEGDEPPAAPRLPAFERPQEEASSASTEIRPKMSSRELLSIVKSQAMNETDRYNMLDARDKLLREKMPPKSGEVRLKGCCPDICPEKERYSRAIKNQLRIYEKIDGGRLNHKAAIKEYSRSSADQEMPLLHELRPSKVLRMAMDHLLCNVIDRIENMRGSMEEWFDHVLQSSFEEFQPESELSNENTGEWFEYIWSATRAIRKDITQQDLNRDPVAVDLMEKCARFHIMCAERLIEEESHNFDKKLNDENLTKCIQTLKHMYYDMGVEGRKCPNEAEFRGYDALLNVNDGDTIRFIQTLDMDVRKSPEIKFAVDVISAVNNNNYIKFFKLVKKSTLMQGCILLRYFNQVRQRALETMVKAFVPGKSVVTYSLTKLCHMLAFESLRECARFCNSHGLGAEEDSDSVYMERSSFYFPESLNSTRAQNLVESKRLAPWSVVINNNMTLPMNPYLSYVPHDSFDKNGFLKAEACEVIGQTSTIVKAPIAVAPPQPSNEEIAQANAKRAYEKAAAEVTLELVSEVISEECSKAAKSLMESVKVVEIARALIATLEEEVVDEMARDVAKDAMKEARNEELLTRLEIEAKSAATEEALTDIIDEVLDAMTSDVAREEIKSVNKTLDEFKSVPLVVDDIVLDVIKSLAEPIGKAVMDHAIEEREEKLQALRRRCQSRAKRAAFSSWHRYVTKRKSQRSILENFPCIPSSSKTADQLKSNLKKSWSLKSTLTSRRTVDKLYEIIELEDKFLEDAILEPMDDLLDFLSANGLKMWKLLICTPSLESDSIGRGLVEMTKKKLMINEGSLSEQDQDPNVLSCFSSPDGSICSRWLDNDMVEDICFCEKKRREQLTGTSAVLFLHIDEEECLDDSKSRLFKLIEQIPQVPGVALLILTTCRSMSKTDLGQEFELQSLVSKGLVHSYDIVATSVDIFSISTVLTVHNSVKGLAGMSRHFDIDSIDGLSVKVIRDYVDDFLVEKFFTEVYLDLSSRQAKNWPHRRMNDLISFFNAVVDHLVSTSCSRPELNDISWPIPELKRLVIDEEIPSYWNDFPHLEHVRAWISGLKLPLMKPIKSIDNLYDYLGQIRRSYSDFSVTLSRIESALGKSLRKSHSIDDLPWTEIMHALIDYKLGQRPTVDPFSTCGSDMVVLYFSQHLDEFKTPLTWTASMNAAPENVNQIQSRGASYENTVSFYGKSKLSVDLTSELDSSFAFEQALQAMMSEEDYEAPLIEISADMEDEDVEDECEEQKMAHYYPVVALVSPHLALVAGSRSMQQRLSYSNQEENELTGMEPPAKNDVLRVKPIKSHLVRRLNETAEEELKSSMSFEQKLRAALGAQ